MRAAHLFESYSFRKRFKDAIDHLVAEKFSWLPVVGCQLSDEVLEQVKASAEFIREHGEGISLDAAQEFLEYDNGNLASISSITHYCLNGHCKNGDDTLRDAQAAIRRVLCACIGCPLLYRFKHFEPAQDYVIRGLRIHGLLLEALKNRATWRRNVEFE